MTGISNTNLHQQTQVKSNVLTIKFKTFHLLHTCSAGGPFAMRIQAASSSFVIKYSFTYLSKEYLA